MGNFAAETVRHRLEVYHSLTEILKDFYAFFKHLEEKGIESTDRGVMVIAMNKLREIMLEAPEVLDNARLSSDGKTLYLIKNKRTNILG